MYPGPPIDKEQKSDLVEATQGQISIPMMLAIIGLSVASILMLIILATCYIRQKRSPKSSHTGSATGTSESSLPESPEEHHFTHLKNHYEVQRPNFMYGGGQFWNQHHIYPGMKKNYLIFFENSRKSNIYFGELSR